MEFNSTEDFLENQSFINYCLKVNKQDVDFWTDYAAKHPDKLHFIEEATGLINDLQLLLMAEKLKPQAVSKLRTQLASGRRRLRISIGRSIAAAAAVLLIVAAAIFMFYPSQYHVSTPELAKFSVHRYFFQAGAKERKSVNLWDGSFVILDKGAKLIVDPTFGKSDRKLYLSGTAYFKVAKDKAHPFKVYTGQYVTTALGTAFRLQANNILRKLKVELEEGKVSIEKKNGRSWSLITTLNPNESISLGNDVFRPMNRRFSDVDLNRWKVQEVIFQNAPIKEVLLQLEIYYNVSITVENGAVVKDTFNGKFKHDSLQSVMEMLCFSINKKFKFIDKNHITIY